MKRDETSVSFTSAPAVESVGDFAIECRRTRSNIAHALADGHLNWGKVLGLNVIIMDDLAHAYIEKCRAADRLKRLRKD